MNRFCYNVYSQNGEDGVINALLAIFRIRQGWVCEFGAWDGRYLSNTFNLVENGFSGVLIEGDFEKFQDLVKTSYNYKNVIPVHATVEASGAKCLDEILKNTSIPIDFDVLSIDIDSFDYHVWQGTDKFFPKIVVIEINSSFPPSERYVYGDGCQSGSSFRSMLELGQSKGYTFVCHTGNMIFVRNDLVSKIQNEVPSPPESGFLWNWVAR
jgi:hypothetical protein